MTKSKTNTTAKRGKTPAKELDYSYVTVETIPTYSQRELREIAKHFGIKIPRTFHSQPTIADYLGKVMMADPLILKEKLREDRNLTSEQWGQCKQLCSLLCSYNEIAYFFGMSMDQLQKACMNEYKVTFTEFYAKESSGGLISLRRAQMQSALGKAAVYDSMGRLVKKEVPPNVIMQIFLGKSQLQQVEAKEQKGGQTTNAITMEQLAEILLEQEGDGVFGDNGGFSEAYKRSKEVEYQGIDKQSSKNGELAQK